jgi:hypothetical protein
MGTRTYTPAEIEMFRQRDNALTEKVNTTLADDAAMLDIQAQLDKTASTVRRLSRRNEVLLLTQATDRGIALRDIDTYCGWVARGRTVRRGTTSLRIVAPRRSASDEATTEQDSPLPRYRMVPVFDISQTEDPDDTTDDGTTAVDDNIPDRADDATAPVPAPSTADVPPAMPRTTCRGGTLITAGARSRCP